MIAPRCSFLAFLDFTGAGLVSGAGAGAELCISGSVLTGKLQTATHCKVHGAAGSGLWRQADPHSSNRPPAAVHHGWSTCSHSRYLSSHVPLLDSQAFAKSAGCDSCALPTVETIKVERRPITAATP